MFFCVMSYCQKCAVFCPTEALSCCSRTPWVSEEFLAEASSESLFPYLEYELICPHVFLSCLLETFHRLTLKFCWPNDQRHITHSKKRLCVLEGSWENSCQVGLDPRYGLATCLELFQEQCDLWWSSHEIINLRCCVLSQVRDTSLC